MQYKKLVAILSIFISLRAYSQLPTASVSGKVVDQLSKQPVELVTIQLLHAGDNAIVAATASDKKGKFAFSQVAPGNYILQYTYVGFSSSTKLAVKNESTIDAGIIDITTVSKNMKEVVVTSKRSLLNTSIDRKIYNVSQDIMAQSGSASDILKNVPSIEVDIDGQVSLRGSADVLILINGRPSPLMGKSRAEVLQQLPANSIERIEVITNPSARYKPDGTSGIINIVLKKEGKIGWNGSAIVNAGNNDRYNSSISLNYKPGKLNLFGNYGIRKDRRIRLNSIDRTYLDGSDNASSYYNEKSYSPTRPLSHLATLGADYTIDDKNSIGLTGNYQSRNQVKHDVTNRFYYDPAYILTGNNDRLRYDPEFEKEKDLTVYWQHNFAKEDKELRIELNLSTQREAEDNHYTTVYHYPVSKNTFDNTYIFQGNNQQQVTIDYVNPVSESSKFEAGYAGSFNQLDLDFRGEYYDTIAGKFINDQPKTNQFTYSESIHAGYATYQQAFGKFGYSAGLRMEEAIINGNLVTKDSAIQNNYFKVYPTLHLSYKLKTGELQVNYSKRVHRPEGDDLNPFPEYQDPFNLRAGNPKLLPEIIHSVEFGYKWQNDHFSFVPSLYYRYKKNGFTSVTIPLNDSVLLTTQQNLSNDQSAGLELIFSAKAGKFFSANMSSTVFYNQIDASSLGYSTKRATVSMSTNLNTTFTLTKTTMWQISSNIRSARLTPQGKIYPNFVLNTGFRQDLLKKKMSLILSVADIFKTLKQRSELNIPDLRQVSIGRRDMRIIYLGLSYRFGKTIKKQADEKIQFDNGL